MLKYLGIGSALALVFAAPSYAATDSADTEAFIVEQVNFAMLLNMNFGNILVSGNAGTITLDHATGNRTCTGVGVACTGTFSMSRLELSGDERLIKITWSPSFSLTGPGVAIPVSITSALNQGDNVNLTGGFAVVEFGAIMSLNAGQAAGVYTGSFSVTADYQ
jgi:Mat/Ecp fimbriae major subunit